MKKTIWCVFGTRPEVVKMAPIVHDLTKSDAFNVVVIATAQHRQMLDQMMDIFDIKAAQDMDIMTESQSMADITCRVLSKMQALFQSQDRPDCVLVQGDTTTVMATAMACFYNEIQIGHVEAGLRSGHLRAPFPEEMNRRVATLISGYHFAPTEQAAENLRAEHVAEEKIFVTGNPVVDALNYIIEKHELRRRGGAERPCVLVTCHRRESFGVPVRRIFEAIRIFAERHPEIRLRYPVHPNPSVFKPAHEILGKISNIRLEGPLGYVDFVKAMLDAAFIITDSGGVQEEATALGKRALVLREVTERPEGVEAGFCQLVGMDRDHVLTAAEECLRNPQAPAGRHVYGDGLAARRIARILKEQLK